MTDTQKWVVYMVECTDGTLYTGVSTDLTRRLRQHNGELKGGAGYTRARRPVRLVWSEAADDRSGAQRREYVVRRLKVGDKRLLIEEQIEC
ncbi:MAG: GIY-YIG nuclease family protein [Luminiphilus sp.]|nr:GIY-YIG nuclease family protein [Luminiphilus sp.]